MGPEELFRVLTLTGAACLSKRGGGTGGFTGRDWTGMPRLNMLSFEAGVC